MRFHKVFALFYIFCICLALLLLVAAPLIISTAKKSVAAVCPGAAVGIKTCTFWPPGACTLSGIEIQRAGIYSLSSPSVTARVRGSASFPWMAFEISVNGIVVSFREPKIKVADIGRYVRLQPAGRQFFPVGNIRISDIQLDVQTNDARLNATGSFLLQPGRAVLRAIALHIPALEYAGVNVTNASIDSAVQKPGSFGIEKLSAGKFMVRNIAANAVLDHEKIRLENLSAQVFGGSVKGSASVIAEAGVPYEALIRASDLDLSVFISDLRLAERVELSGKMGALLQVQGSARGCRVLSGDMTTVAPGGVLNIRDQAIIDMIAQRSGQARDLISQSFTDYRYTLAQARLYIEESKLILDVSFQGDAGKRMLKVVLHDFTVQGGGK